jgi:hypothetical protein
MARKFFVGGNWKMFVNLYPAMNASVNPAIQCRADGML